MSDTGSPLSTDDLQEVLDATFAARKSYRFLGLALRLSPDIVDCICNKIGGEKDKLCEILQEFLRKIDPPPTWDLLIAALETQTVDQKQLAQALRVKYGIEAEVCQETQSATPHTSTLQGVVPYPDGIPDQIERNADDQPSTSVALQAPITHKENASFPADDFDSVVGMRPTQISKTPEKAEMVAIRQTPPVDWGTRNTDPTTKDEIAIRDEADDMISMYAALLSKAQESTGCVVCDHDQIKWVPISHGVCGSEMINKKSVRAMVSMTPTFCSFLNLDLMDCIIEEVGDDKQKQQKMSYAKMLHKFRQSTSFHTFWRMLPRTFPEEPDGFCRLQVVLDWNVDEKIERMETLRQQLVSFHPLYRCALLLRKIKLDPLSIEWLIPSSMQEVCKCLKERETEFFKDHSIVRCFLDGTVIDNSTAADLHYDAMTELTKYLRTLAGDVNPEQLNHLVFLCEGLESVPQYLESALDIFRMFTYGGKMRRLQFYLHDISEVIGLHADPQKLEEYGIPKKDVAVPDFSPKYLFHRCLTQIALTMNADDVTQMFAEFIRTWDGIQYDKYSTALDLFRILISRNIVGPTKVEVLSNVMGYVSSMCKHRHFIETYLKATHTHVIQEQVYPTVSLPSAEVESLLKKFQNLLQHNATAEMYKMREIEHPFCEKCSYEQKLSRCPKCPTTEIQYRGIAQVFSNFSPELVDNYDEIYCKRFLNKLGYYVYVNQNCVLTEFDAILSRRREEYKRHAEYDSFVCCVTSKGDNGKILDSEGKICNPSHLMSHFSDDMCPNLKGKPRVFLVQTYSKHSSSPLLLPSPQLDCLYVCHVLPVEYQRKGSLFIRALRGIVQKCGAYSDLMSMLTKVNQYIAESESSESVYVPVIVSHLQKLICFPSRVP